MSYVLGEVRYSEFPLEEDDSQYTERPAIIIDDSIPEAIIVIKVTRRFREEDEYDVPIKHWRHCGLKYPSVARVGKVTTVHNSKILNRRGFLHPDDQKRIIDKLIEFSNR